jgi:hypothetical protein
MAKLLKNTTLSDIFITDCGVNLPALSTYEIDPNNYAKWAASVDVISPILANSVVGNDAIRDFPSYLTIMMLRHDAAENLGFNNTTNDFVSTNVQAAIEEIRFNGGHFSYRRIPSGKIIIIPEEQQMWVYQELKCDPNSELVIRGEVVIK